MNSTFKIISERLELNRYFDSDDKYINTLILEYKNLNCPFHIHNVSSEMKFLIYKKGVAELVGFCGIDIDYENSSGKIFYILFPQHKRNGFAIESIRSLTKFAFTELNLKFIKAEIPFKLKGAWKPAERAGMRYMGDFREQDQNSRFLLFKIDKKEYLNQAFY